MIVETRYCHCVVSLFNEAIQKRSLKFVTRESNLFTSKMLLCDAAYRLMLCYSYAGTQLLWALKLCFLILNNIIRPIFSVIDSTSRPIIENMH